MAEDRKILLYQIDEQEKMVVFAETADDESAWTAITESDLTALSFDEFFRQMTEFRSEFLEFEQVIELLLTELNQSGKKLRQILKDFADPQQQSENFFMRYYAGILCEIITSARAEIDKAGALRNTGAAKKAAAYVQREFNRIRKVTLDGFHFDAVKELRAIRVPCEKIIIRGNERNEVYSIADSALSNFFYDFSFAVHKLKLYACECQYCRKQYLGEKNSTCCDAETCQAAHQRAMKNARRREHEKSPYRRPITTITNYLSQAMYTLRACVQDDPAVLAVFREKREEFMQQIRDKVAEYEVEHRSPDDAEMARFVAALEGEIGRLRTNLIEGWRE